MEAGKSDGLFYPIYQAYIEKLDANVLSCDAPAALSIVYPANVWRERDTGPLNI